MHTDVAAARVARRVLRRVEFHREGIGYAIVTETAGEPERRQRRNPPGPGGSRRRFPGRDATTVTSSAAKSKRSSAEAQRGMIMEAIDYNILFDEADEVPAGICGGCGVAMDCCEDTSVADPTVYCRSCAESGVFPV